MDIIRIIIAILLPPLRDFLREGLGQHFWIKIILTIFGYVSGNIRALYIIIKR
ncbi:YqaE/Pmp3 family membrane protein [Marinovum sp.]|uniref:YqaE/Pmp3 family membrane protein n=1 Tax=Marinovum sp. TaxID=2024839 RepID=UPI002B274316|nr:YqaE/Pmp3 family membrane protein [Marinovum sp.]